MIQELEFGRLLVIFDREYSLSEFRTVSQVAPDSYADEVLERVHNCLFKYSKNLVSEYENFYAMEYSNFSDFLYWKYKINEDILKQMEGRIKNGAYVGYARDSIWMLEDKKFGEILNCILSELGDSGAGPEDGYCDGDYNW